MGSSPCRMAPGQSSCCTPLQPGEEDASRATARAEVPGEHPELWLQAAFIRVAFSSCAPYGENNLCCRASTAPLGRDRTEGLSHSRGAGIKPCQGLAGLELGLTYLCQRLLDVSVSMDREQTRREKVSHKVFALSILFIPKTTLHTPCRDL